MLNSNAVTRSSFRTDSVAAGTIAGIVAGTFMAVMMMVVSGLGGMGFWHPLELAGGIFYGADAILGGVGPVLTGIVVHLFGAALLGAAFGAILPLERNPWRASQNGKSTGWGVIYGIACWGFVTFLALPLLNQTMKDRIDLAPGWWFLSFVAYGAVLGITPMLRRAFGHQTETIYQEESRRAA